MCALSEMYAIIRTAKLKSSVSGSEMSSKRGTPPQCIDDATDHELRLKATLNADPSKLCSNRLLIFSEGRCDDMGFEEAKRRGFLRHDLFRSLVADRLAAAGISIDSLRRDHVLAQQVMVSASHEFFLPAQATEQDPSAANIAVGDHYRGWRADSISFLNEQYGDRIVAIVEHLDEHTPHMTAVVVPLVQKAVKASGRGSKSKPAGPVAWRLSAFDLFNKKTLEDLWTAYGVAMKAQGLHRPPRHAMITSTIVKEWYSSVADAAGTAEKLEKTLAFSLPPVESRVFAESATKYRDRATAVVDTWRRDVGDLLRALHFLAKEVERLRKRETELRRALREADEQRTAEAQKRSELEHLYEALRIATTDIVAARVLEKLGIPLVVEVAQTLRADLADGRVVRTSSKGFSITGPSPKDCVAGRGAVELLMALFRSNAAEAFKHCVACFGEAGMGAIHAWTQRRFAGRISQENIHLLATRLKPQKARTATDRIPPGQQDVPEERQLKPPGEDVDR